MRRLLISLIILLAVTAAYGQNQFGPDYLLLHCTKPDANSNLAFGVFPRPGLAPSGSTNGSAVLYCDQTTSGIKISANGGAFSGFAGSVSANNGSVGAVAIYPAAGGSTTVGPDATLTDSGTTLTYTGTNGIQVTGSTGSVTISEPFGSTGVFTSNPCETAGAPTTLSTSGTTTNTGQSCLPANAIIDAVVYRITTTITTAASFTIGDSTTAARFCSTQSTLTAGTTGVCMVQWTSATAGTMGQTAAASVRVTTNATPGAGAIRLIVYYHSFAPPTS